MPSRLSALNRLFRPLRAEHPANGTVAVGVVLLVAVAVGWSVAATVPLFEASVSGSVTVDNPARPPDFICGDDFFDQSGCDQPQTIQKQLAPYTASVAANMAFPAGMAVVLGWPFLAAVLWSLTGADDARRGTYRKLLHGSAWAFVPFLVPAAARPFLVERALKQPLYPSSLDAAAETVRSLVVGFRIEPLAGLSFVALVWSAYILTGVVKNLRDISTGRALAVSAGWAVAVGALSAFGNGVPPMARDTLAMGLFLGFLGALWVAAPRPLIEFSKRWELIGFRNGDKVEPAEWYVTLHRAGGLLAVGFGYFVLGGPKLLV
jgi:hypothetical protein